MNNKKAKALRALADHDIRKYEEQNDVKVSKEQKKAFYKSLKKKLKKGKLG